MMKNNQKISNEDFSIIETVQKLWNGRLIIIITTIICIILSYLYSFVFLQDMYVGNSSIMLVPQSQSIINMNMYKELLESDNILDLVVDDSENIEEISLSKDQVRNMTTVSLTEDTNIIDIATISANAESAIFITESYYDNILHYINEKNKNEIIDNITKDIFSKKSYLFEIEQKLLSYELMLFELYEYADYNNIEIENKIDINIFVKDGIIELQQYDDLNDLKKALLIIGISKSEINVLRTKSEIKVLNKFIVTAKALLDDEQSLSLEAKKQTIQPKIIDNEIFYDIKYLYTSSNIIDVSLLEKATLKRVDNYRNKIANIIMGFMGGVLLGVFIVLFRYYWKAKIKA